MPKYEYECPKGHTTDEVRPVIERDDELRCECGEWMQRVQFPSATPYVTRPGVGDRSPFSRDRVGR